MRFSRGVVEGFSHEDEKSSQNRLRTQDLKNLVPLYQAGVRASETLLSTDVDKRDLVYYDTMVVCGDMAYHRLLELSNDLISFEINKLISNSYLPERQELFNVMYMSGVDGMKRGLMKFDVSKIGTSSTNYLFQWIVTYARKELLRAEAPLGVSVSRYERFKKIAAVRSKMRDDMGREPSEDEILQYFHSGRADRRGMKGRVVNAGKPSQANLNITAEMIREQKDLESSMYVSSFDPQNAGGVDKAVSDTSQLRVESNVFSGFVDKYSDVFTPQAVDVLMCELKDGVSTESNVLSARSYQKIAREWAIFLTDKNQVFYDYLKTLDPTGVTEFDVHDVLSMMESRTPPDCRYASLLR